MLLEWFASIVMMRHSLHEWRIITNGQKEREAAVKWLLPHSGFYFAKPNSFIRLPITSSSFSKNSTASALGIQMIP